MSSCNNSCGSPCPDKFGCNQTPDFCIKRHDVLPKFKLIVTEDCGDPMDLTGLVLEASMWAKAKLKRAITVSDTSFQLADNIGFEQIAVGDIIVMDRVRAPEQMLVTNFDENNYVVYVQRGYHGTPISAFKKGTALRIFRVLNAPGSTEMDLEDIQQIDGTVLEDQITESRLVYEWSANDTCLPGCYYFEFKLLTMSDDASTGSDGISGISQTGSYTIAQMGCQLGSGVAAVQRFPKDKEGYLIHIVNSFVAENVY